MRREDEELVELRREVRRDLARRIEAEHPDVILTALHVSSGAFALEMRGLVDPLFETSNDA